jgi:hypothetical protein
MPYKLETSESSLNKINLPHSNSLYFNKEGYAEGIVNKIDQEKVKKRRRSEFTIDQVVNEINKPFITFNKRNSINVQKEITNELIKKKRILKERKSVSSKKTDRKTSKSNDHHHISSIEKENSVFYKKRKSLMFNMKRLQSIVTVICFILYMKNMILRYGVKSRLYTPLIDIELLNKEEWNSNLNQSKLIEGDNYNIINETNKLLKLPWYIIHPETFLLIIWKKFSFILLLFYFTFVPYRFAFTDTYLNSKYFYYYLDIIIELLFLLDFIINCFLAFYDEDGHLVIQFSKILYSYFTSMWFVFDIISIGPFYVYLAIKSNNYE